jgi:putative spore coat protein
MKRTAEIIAENFGIKPVNIYKCKYYYVINSARGSYSMSIARPSRDRIETIHKYKETLCKNGFYSLDNYMSANNGKPYFEYDGNIYTLCKYYGSSELDMLSNIQSSIALETIGSMATAIKEDYDDIVCASQLNNQLISNYRKQISKLQKSKKMLSSNKEFDRKLKKFICLVINKAENSVNNLEKLGYGNEITICHNSLKEGNIIYSKGRCRIIDWDNMKKAHYLEDGAFFIKRYIRKNAFYTKDTLAKYMNINTLLHHYTKYNKLSQSEYDILYELLNYPHRFIKLINEYCSKNRGFVPSGLAGKLDECMEGWEFCYDYLGTNV